MVPQKLATLASRLLSLIVLPAQLPGDVVGMLEDLARAPFYTVRRWSLSVVWRLLRQLVQVEKLTIPDNNQLQRMSASRQGYLSRGWALVAVSTMDGYQLDAVIKEPPASASRSGGGGDVAPRFVIFVGGNFQKYEDWLPYYEVYARVRPCCANPSSLSSPVPLHASVQRRTWGAASWPSTSGAWAAAKARSPPQPTWWQMSPRALRRCCSVACSPATCCCTASRSVARWPRYSSPRRRSAASAM